MGKFNVVDKRSSAREQPPAGVIVTATTSTGSTHQGGAGFVRPDPGALFLLAVSNMVGENTFYESGADRDGRYINLVGRVTRSDPEWMVEFLRWLRHDANMRSASLVGAAGFAKARLEDGGHGLTRQVIDSVLDRADEPGELLAHWVNTYGRNVPKPVKRGIADACRRLYTQRGLLKYDTATHPFRFGDVLDLVHPTPDPDRPDQADVFRHALNRRHGRDDLGWLRDESQLTTIYTNHELREAAATRPDVLLDPDLLRRAGMTWEDALSLAGSRVSKAKLWEALAPSMGYMALLRNLRNFDEAGVSDKVAAQVAARLADPAEVARSRQLPMRFLSAYRAIRSDRWKWPLDQALTASLDNVPALPGRTLVLVDTSGSMGAGFSRDGTLKRWDAAVLFGLAVAHRAAHADMVSFSDGSIVFPAFPGESLLAGCARWERFGFNIGSGTETARAVRKHYNGHDRILVLTDEQAGHDANAARGVFASVPANVPVYTWNLAGYQHGHAPGGVNRYVFGGLTDAGFAMVPLLENAAGGVWPWQTQAAG